jgi:hypothetical protein
VVVGSNAMAAPEGGGLEGRVAACVDGGGVDASLHAGCEGGLDGIGYSGTDS